MSAPAMVPHVMPFTALSLGTAPPRDQENQRRNAGQADQNPRGHALTG
jgi:hypothetical protein